MRHSANKPYTDDFKSVLRFAREAKTNGLCSTKVKVSEDKMSHDKNAQFFFAKRLCMHFSAINIGELEMPVASVVSPLKRRTLLPFVRALLIIGVVVLRGANAKASTVEPSLHLDKRSSALEVALTFDLCSGDTDHRILDRLIAEKIKATLFLTERWIKRNPQSVELIKKHSDLFEVANHGAQHIPAIDNQSTIYGLRTAGSLNAICKEVTDGNVALQEAGFAPSVWYRTAAARYSPDALQLIAKMGYLVAGFSVNGDQGASLSAAKAADRVKNARDGDVIIAHMNQPNRASGEGIINGILSLKRRGFQFFRLSEGIKSPAYVTARPCSELVSSH